MRYKITFDLEQNDLVVQKTRSKLATYTKRRTAKKQLNRFLKEVSEHFSLTESDLQNLTTQDNLNAFVGYAL
jgi:hypothetical protein